MGPVRPNSMKLLDKDLLPSPGIDAPKPTNATAGVWSPVPCVRVLQNQFTPKSDVWSFAVTLWEILTFARERPFEALTDDQVVDNCARCGAGQQLDVVLGQPANCPREIYDLMVECWNRVDVQRPSFREIHMFLQRKNMGYSPSSERTDDDGTSSPLPFQTVVTL